MGKEVTLPGLYDGMESVDSFDVQLPSVYLMADLSKAVKKDLLRPGDSAIMLGSDDDDPVPLIDRRGSLGEPRESFDAYILARQRTVARIDGQDFEFLPSDYERQPDERDVWVGYNYMLAIPDVYPMVPCRMLLIKTSGRPVFQKINYWLQKAQAERASDPVHVRFTTGTQYSKTAKVDYWVYKPTLIPTNPDTLDAALAMMGYVQSFKTENEAPEATGAPAF